MATRKSTALRRLPEDRIGEVFDQLTVIAIVRSPKGHKMALCRCTCGGEHRCTVIDLERGRIKRCLACQRKGANNGNFRHGGKAAKMPEYEIWMAIHRRCRHPENNPRGDYFGVSVCERWTGPDGFANFMADMGPRPSADHSIDRKDNDGSYEPSNCRWATEKEQQRNRRNNRLVTYNGQSLTIGEWAERIGMKYGMLRSRIYAGWSPERALTTPKLVNQFG